MAQSLNAVRAVRARRRGRARRKAHREQRQRQPSHIREHVSRIGQQREAPREQPPNDFRDERERREAQDERQTCGMRARRI
jgi:hypothetical protein